MLENIRQYQTAAEKNQVILFGELKEKNIFDNKFPSALAITMLNKISYFDHLLQPALLNIQTKAVLLAYPMKSKLLKIL